MTEPTMLEQIEDVNTQLRRANALLNQLYWDGYQALTPKMLEQIRHHLDGE